MCFSYNVDVCLIKDLRLQDLDYGRFLRSQLCYCDGLLSFSCIGLVTTELLADLLVDGINDLWGTACWS